jgi:hypothetical protein
MQLLTLAVVETIDIVGIAWALCEQSSLTQKREDVDQVVVVRELFNILKKSFAWDAD